MAELATDLLSIVVRVQEAQDLGEPAALRKLIAHYLRQFDEACRAAGIGAAAAADGRYALVALLDETVLSSAGACRDHWLANPLQLELYGESIAGEEFYRRLRSRLDAAAPATDVLELYHLCLAMGYGGKYRMGRQQERHAVMQELGRALARGRPAAGLSPHARRFDAAAGSSRMRQLVSLTALACVLVAAAAWVALAASSMSQAGSLLRLLQPLVAR